MILKREFYLQPTLKVARELLGKKLCYSGLEGRITETEAYLQNDKACHASCGMTERNRVMFGPPGHAYVYFTYGMHYCMNVVTQAEGIAEAVLIRAVEPLKGVEQMIKNRGRNEYIADGPAKLCQAFGVDKKLNGADMTQGKFVIRDDGFKPKGIKKSGRIGIKLDADKLWRFYF
jgi:DNA-3-methyladenine glycosylase